MKPRFEALIECVLIPENGHRGAMWGIQARVTPGCPRDILSISWKMPFSNEWSDYHDRFYDLRQTLFLRWDGGLEHGCIGRWRGPR